AVTATKVHSSVAGCPDDAGTGAAGAAAGATAGSRGGGGGGASAPSGSVFPQSACLKSVFGQRSSKISPTRCSPCSVVVFQARFVRTQLVGSLPARQIQTERASRVFP